MIKIYDARCQQSNHIYFSWRLKGKSDQSAYQIRVFNGKNEMVWDSGKREENRRHNIVCEAVLQTGQKYYWIVNCTGKDGSEDTVHGEWFYTQINHWEAKWVEPTRVRKPLTDSINPHEVIEEIDPLGRLDPSIYFRKEFTLEEQPEYAVIYATAYGIYALWINGVLVSDMFAPGYTSYSKRLEYQCYDISSNLKIGKNSICAVVADGWYTGKIGAVGVGQQYGQESALLFQIECKHKSGEKQIICSDEKVKWNTGAWRYADLFVGEYYDEAYEHANWLTTSFDQYKWRNVKQCEYGYKNLELQSIPPVKEFKTIKPKIMRSPKGELILDSGENIVGFVSFRLNLKADTVISMEHSETLDKEGNFLQNIIGHNKQQTDLFCCRQDGWRTWKPLFTFHGFRYIRVTGTDDMNPEHYTIHVIVTPMKQSGTFICSDSRINQLHENILRSQQGNMICIPTDCPQREKTGWTGDVQIYAPTACYEQDVEQFLRHWLRDVENEQLSDGQIPHIIPYIPSHDYMKPPGIEGVSSAGWSDAAVIVPWRLYEAYGDSSILEENFTMIYRYMESVREKALEIPIDKKNASPDVLERQKYLWNTGFQYGDWLMPSIQINGGSIFEVVKQTGYIVATLMYAITTRIMSKICHVLKKEKLENEYIELNKKICQAFVEEYMNPDGTITKEYQGVYVLALEAEVIPHNLRRLTLERLIQLIHNNNDLLDTGFLSVPYLLPVLVKNGEKGLANKLLFRDECPSWLYEVKMGATTLWEYWNGYAEDGTPAECSMNHFAFGCVGEYLYRYILGIDFVEPGFRRIKINPDISCGLSKVEGSYESIWGQICVLWEIKDKVAKIEVTIPPDTEAEVILGNEKLLCGCGKWTLQCRIE